MNLIFMGAPGSGKGTQAGFVYERMGIAQISTGELLRKAVKNQTEEGYKAKAYMDKGDLVPDEIMLEIIKNQIIRKNYKKGFILDGFPRTEDQARALDVILNDISKEIDRVLFFDVDDKELINRLLKRSKNEGRTDDNMKVIQNRLKIFRDKTKLVLNYYEKKKSYAVFLG